MCADIVECGEYDPMSLRGRFPANGWKTSELLKPVCAPEKDGDDDVQCLARLLKRRHDCPDNLSPPPEPANNPGFDRVPIAGFEVKFRDYVVRSSRKLMGTCGGGVWRA